MKITCTCGSVLSDNTDFISYKAYLVADQDRFDHLDAVATRDSNRFERRVYQCFQCGRLLLQNRAGDLHHYTSFVPDDRVAAEGALRSNLGKRWRGLLRARWEREREIWWYVGDGESGSEVYGSWEQFERRYHELFASFRARDVLRSAMLSRDGEVVHAWSGPEET